MQCLLRITVFIVFGLEAVLAGISPSIVFSTPSVSTNIYLPENSAIGTTIIALVASGGTGALTYFSAESKVTVGGSTGIMTINDVTLLNFESGATLNVVVTVVDSAGSPVTATGTVVVNIIDLPSFTPAMPLLCVTDGATAGTAIGSVKADGSGTYTYARKASGNDANATDITVSSAGAVTVSSGVTLDAGTDLLYNIIVEVTDANSEVGTYTVFVYVGCTLSSSSGSAGLPAGLATMMMAAISTILYKI